MKTIKQAIENSNINPSLIRSVVKQLGGYDSASESMEDIVNHGASGGFSGFIYYSDTVDFFKRNKKYIVELIEQLSDDLGEDPTSLVAGFNCLKYDLHDKEERNEITRALYGRLSSNDTNVANALAWFAAEEVARAFVE